MVAREECFRGSGGTKEGTRNYSLWLGPGTAVFAGDPDGGNPVSGGTIPENTEVKITTLFGWPKRKEGYVEVLVREIHCLVTDVNWLIRYGEETLLSVGGFTLGVGDIIWVNVSRFKTAEGRGEKGETQDFQLKFNI